VRSLIKLQVWTEDCMSIRRAKNSCNTNMLLQQKCLFRNWGETRTDDVWEVSAPSVNRACTWWAVHSGSPKEPEDLEYSHLCAMSPLTHCQADPGLHPLALLQVTTSISAFLPPQVSLAGDRQGTFTSLTFSFFTLKQGLSFLFLIRGLICKDIMYSLST
jgi:hypothetical protein